MFLIRLHYKKSEHLKEISELIGSALDLTEDASHPGLKGALVLGGDGTLLRVIDSFKEEVPVIYFLNYGSYGFLAPFEASQLVSVVSKIKEGFPFKILERRRLEVSGLGHALNDVLITRRTHGRLNRFRILVNGHGIGEVRCDSVLISTASGSSGYNYSSGGPLLPCTCDMFVLNCLNPSQVCFRPLVLDRFAEVQVDVLESLHEKSEPLCVIDGHREIRGKDSFTFAVSPFPIRFASFEVREAIFAKNASRLHHLG